MRALVLLVLVCGCAAPTAPEQEPLPAKVETPRLKVHLWKPRGDEKLKAYCDVPLQEGVTDSTAYLVIDGHLLPGTAARVPSTSFMGNAPKTARITFVIPDEYLGFKTLEVAVDQYTK